MTIRRISSSLPQCAACVLFVILSLAGCSRAAKQRGGAPSSGPLTLSFESDSIGQLPAHWEALCSDSEKKPASWQVIAAPHSAGRALACVKPQHTERTFNIALCDQWWMADVDLTVRVYSMSGVEDQGGGPIWRARDTSNYYICRFNPLESNYRVYKVVDGERKQLASIKLETQAGRWYTVRVVMKDTHIVCYLDGKEYLNVNDDTLSTAGRIGLWTKADAEAAFDDLGVAEPRG